MNKVILMGRLTRDPEIRYSQSAEPVAVTKYTLAVNRRFKQEGEADADFINCVAFRKNAEFAEKYFKKGQMVAVVGSLKVSTVEDANGQKRWYTDVIIDDQYFAESKSSAEANRSKAPDYIIPPPDYSQSNRNTQEPQGFTAITETIDDEDLPF